MKRKDLKKIAKQLWALETKCQNGEEISKSMELMTKLCESLSLEEMLQLAEVMESST